MSLASCSLCLGGWRGVFPRKRKIVFKDDLDILFYTFARENHGTPISNGFSIAMLWRAPAWRLTSLILSSSQNARWVCLK